MYFGDKWTSCIDNFQILSLGSFHNSIGYTMSAENSYFSRRDTLHIFGKNNSTCFQIVYYLLIMNDLVQYIDWCPIKHQCLLDDFYSGYYSGTKSSRISKYGFYIALLI